MDLKLMKFYLPRRRVPIENIKVAEAMVTTNALSSWMTKMLMSSSAPGLAPFIPITLICYTWHLWPHRQKPLLKNGFWDDLTGNFPWHDSAAKVDKLSPSHRDNFIYRRAHSQWPIPRFRFLANGLELKCRNSRFKMWMSHSPSLPIPARWYTPCTIYLHLLPSTL